MKRHKWLIALLNSLFTKKVTIAKWELNVFGIFMIALGIIFGSYITTQNIIPKIFATTQAAITYQSNTDFNNGTLSSTQVIGTGGSPILSLAGSSGPDGTKYQVPVIINNSSNSNNLTNYQVPITLNTAALISAGKLLSDCRDLRFMDSNQQTIINYWIENCNNSATKIWVKIPSIPASSTKTIYMYYGGPTSDISNSSVSNTFIDDISGVAGAWSFDESSGSTATDTSGNSLTATAYGTTIVPGKFGNARSFGLNSGDAVTFNNVNLGTSWTVDAWVKFPIPYGGNWRTLFAHDGGNYHQILIQAGSNILGYYNGAWYPCGFDVSTVSNGWHLMTSVGSGGSTNFYIDGTNVCTDSGQISNQQVGAIGDFQNGGGQGFGTAVDEPRIYTVALTATQINELANNYGYVTSNYPDHELIRQYSSPEPTSNLGTEGYALSPSGNWESASNSNVIDLVWNGGWGDGTNGSSTAFSATVASVSANQTIAFQIRVASSSADLTSQSYLTLGTINSGTTFSVTKSQMDSLGVGTGTNRYVQVKITFAQTTGISPQLSSFSIYYAKDNTPPETNATSVQMSTANAGISISSSGWDNSPTPYFSWTPGSDSQSGIKGYCLYLGTDNTVNPTTTSPGLLNSTNSPVSVSSTQCGGGSGFIVSSSSIDLSTSGYINTAMTSSNSLYYFGVAAVDNAGNVDPNFTFFPFYYDGTPPTNVGYLIMPSQNFSNVADMNFAWPNSGNSAASDQNSGILGYQYQINSTTGQWQGTSYSPTLNLDYIPATASSYSLLPSRDESSIVTGSNIVYFRTIDNAGNFSSPDTYRTGNLNYGGAAPVFPGNGIVTINPSTSATNSYALSWPNATPQSGQNITHYYYMINNSPPSSLSTLQNNSGMYLDNGTSTTVNTLSLPNVVKGTNTVYVVAIDNASTPNYSPSNYVMGRFSLNSSNPDPVQNLLASDSSIKSQSKWDVTLTWTAGTYQGAGNLTYLIYRSSDGTNFSQVGSTSGLSYVDNTPASQLYYYYIITQDGANAKSSDSTTVSITPTGKYTSPPNLQSGPSVSGITTQQATITWSTDRNGDSKVAYGISSGNYYTTEPYVADQVTSHIVTLNNLSPGTTYYYKVYWTDTDGNTGSSTESSFSTAPAPTIQGVLVTNIGLSSGLLNFTANGASSVKIYYGQTNSFGSVVTLSTSTSQTTYTQLLSNLIDGTKYYYKINGVDSSGTEYQGTILDFTTLPRPKISNITIDQVAGTAQPTILVQWISNTSISSIITYYPLGDTPASRDQVDVALIKGQHQLLISGLNPKTTYQMIVKGRDKIGNEAQSDIQTFTTATDTRPPYVSNLSIQGSSTPSSSSQSQTTQLVVTWDTDKLSTSQVEYAQGTGTSYSQKTQQDSNYTFNHLVIISGLNPSQVYHLKALSVDKYGNLGESIDTVTITPDQTSSALNLVIGNLQQAFGFLGALNSGN